MAPLIVWTVSIYTYAAKFLSTCMYAFVNECYLSLESQKAKSPAHQSSLSTQQPWSWTYRDVLYSIYLVGLVLCLLASGAFIPSPENDITYLSNCPSYFKNSLLELIPSARLAHLSNRF